MDYKRLYFQNNNKKPIFSLFDEKCSKSETFKRFSNFTFDTTPFQFYFIFFFLIQKFHFLMNTCISVDSTESKIDKIGLSLTLKNLTPTGATLVFIQNNSNGTPTGELNYSDDFIIQVHENGAWEQAHIVLEGDYTFNSIAYIIQLNSTSEREIRWEWLYGSLKPGEYRIQKSIIDFRATANFDKYTISAQFRVK